MFSIKFDLVDWTIAITVVGTLVAAVVGVL
jgi:hypothetical protein